MKKIIFCLLFLAFLWDIGYTQNSCSDYSYVPPTFVSQVPPTVMIGLDTSGSMSWDAYMNNFSDNNTYEGLFNPGKNYEKVNGVWQETASVPTTSCPSPDRIVHSPISVKACNLSQWYPSWYSSWWLLLLGYFGTNEYCIDTEQIYSGNCLNYWLMSRMDVFQWAMTGGEPEQCTGNNSSKCDAERVCTGSTCDVVTGDGVVIRALMVDNQTNHGIKDAVLYQLLEKDNRPRLGIMTYSGSHSNSYINDDVYIGDFTSAQSLNENYPYTNLITAINSASPYGGTPTGPAMWDIWNYFKQESPEYGGLSPVKSATDNSNQFKDPLWICENSSNGLVCNYAPCSSNYVVLASDGQWNTPSTDIDYNCSDPSSDTCRSPDPVIPGYKMHMGANRNKDNANVKIDSVYTLGMFLGGTGEQSLKNVAMYGSFDKSLAGGVWPDSLTGFPDDSCTMDDGGSGQGSACEPLPSSSADWDEDGNNLPDSFFSANNAAELKDKIQSIFTDILKRASSGTSLSSVSSESRESSMLFQAYYYPTLVDNSTGQEISWVGDLRSYFVDDKDNVREDTDNNNILNYATDKILIFKFFQDVSKTMALKIDDNNKDQIPDSCALPSSRHDLLDLFPLWSTSKWLKNLNSDSRTIMYNNGTPNQSITNNFNISNASSLKNYWGISSDSEASKLIKFIRGYDYPNDKSYRSRNFLTTNASEVFKGVYKLGDVINSTPRVLTNEKVNKYDNIYGDWSYYNFSNSNTVENRKSVAFFGANDGMVHAVSVGKIVDNSTNSGVSEVVGQNLGEELWAFIPKNALPYLQWYHKEDKSCHVPKIDYRFQLVDASIGTETNKKDSWRTLLVGTMGFGGKEIVENFTTYSSSIFVLDVTDPENAKILWEKKLPNNTLTLSYPSIIRQGAKSSKGSWYLVIGSGPFNPAGTDFSYQANKAKIYFYNLADGSLVNTLTVPENNVAVGESLSLDVDHDYNVDALVFGTYGAADTAAGNLYILHIRSDASNYLDITNLAGSNIEKILDINKPIYGMPTDALDENNDLWLYAGTGRFLGVSDKVDNSTQYILGIKDKNKLWQGNSAVTTSSLSDLFNSTNVTVDAYIDHVSCYCFDVKCGEASFDVTSGSYVCSKGDPVVDKIYGDKTSFKVDGTNLSVTSLANYLYKDTVNGGGGYDGWYYELNGGKRVYSKPFLAGNVLDSLVFESVQDLCSYGGTTYLVANYYETGTPAPQPMFLNSGQNIVTVTENGQPVKKIIIKQTVDLGSGAPPIGGGITAMPQKGSDDEYTKLIQTSVGTITKQKQKGQSFSNELIHMITR
ncbi:Tfp pilus assembly protein tip-associated adhesin PilY1-like protein [Flexistipes sinusarabici DSM 4947]|uniref:Tfp pilus assembly protein tip-associated adhesin PilY1-like protein n=1 Tax=Flexistipes sinusarabici (strain ATCC 49648 / DSM 4947 / MAS 10) TaxID=717231 RepID=F8E4U1_FLESM|nr:PilC/PilY family type IV pilus protein [Flexistipes sinusarabici]AEI14511.1 Tfp pilus assembly protein tip-associated adhesin PilY1-like protein [Flexistipes sinusarabici DSM 4947]